MQSFAELLHFLSILPGWASHLIVSVLLTWTVCMAGLIIGRTGRSPYWAVLVLVPYAGVLGLWYLALARWPRETGRAPGS